MGVSIQGAVKGTTQAKNQTPSENGVLLLFVEQGCSNCAKKGDVKAKSQGNCYVMV